MLDIIEKLINEHGSSTILKERLALISDRYELLEEKNTDLRYRNEELKQELSEASDEIERLKEIVEKNQKDKNILELDAPALEILEILFETNRAISKEDISAKTDIDLSMVSYHFDNLRNANFIIQTTVGSSSSGGFGRGRGPSHTPAKFSITPAGRSYVVEHIRA